MIEKGKKYGCLIVLDNGENYIKFGHYKCQCKCGRIHYYNQETIESKPKYCYYPIAISTTFRYGVRAQNATYRKRQKYKDIECIILVDKWDCWPSDNYCDLYNKYKWKQLEKKPEQIEEHKREEERRKIEISKQKWYNSLPYEYPSDYGKNKIGRIFGIMEIVGFEFTNNLRQKPKQNSRNDWYREKIVRAKCKCRLCGRLKSFDIEEFEVDSVQGGYVSLVNCDCHNMSSFEWRTIKILEDNNIKYFMEESYQGLVGVDNKTPLRLDFTVVNEQNNILCFIECQGKQHYKLPTEKDCCDFKWTEWNLKKQQENDEKKREFAKKHNKPLIELKYTLNTFEKEKEYLEKELRKLEIIK